MADQLDVTPALAGYVREMSLREDAILRELREETAELPGGASLQVMPEEGQFLGLLVSLVGARSVLELGTYTGYSTLCMARSLPAYGRLITCDITTRWADIGAPFWQRAGVTDRIDLRVGPAESTMDALLADGQAEAFDLVFVDADKAGYPAYYERAVRLVRPGGLVVLDNTLFFGRVTDPSMTDPDTEGVRKVNALIRDDHEVDIVLLTVADGLTLVRRKTA
ncbi:class I SAM-dependent methyltransferase [Umezawaea sp. Da 62-37]|uniref:class I SAM-dependent methyltransferase n=1 Tax=Umezawaea sp. Da 62-37 TaxID=3075927 RepID=UPI0028F6DB1D|nr:class I SAM-dependent methyltransferase [Umezawaea sp. Da 62-37]WNV86269.1 class I SAM-dependent methyltransferase [Umezawaea sp. Da 62-37]